MHALVRDHIKERGAEHALPSRPESDGGVGDAGTAETNANGDINQVSHLTLYRVRRFPGIRKSYGHNCDLCIDYMWGNLHNLGSAL